MPGVTQVQTTLNGEVINFLCEPRQSLLEVLRDVLGMTGTKEGCNDGNCGACTIIMDGRIVDSCLVLGVEAEGAEITITTRDVEPSGVAEVRRKLRGREYWRSPGGVAILSGIGGVALLALAAGSDSEVAATNVIP